MTTNCHLSVQQTLGLLVERGVRQEVNEASVVLYPPLGKLRVPSNTPHDHAALRDRLGFPDVRWHSFRKSVATALKDAGVSPREDAYYLGHQKIDLTLDAQTTHGGGSTRVADVLSNMLALE